MSKSSLRKAKLEREGVICWQDTASVAVYGASLQAKAKRFVETAQKQVASSDHTRITHTLSEMTRLLQDTLISGDFENVTVVKTLTALINDLEGDRMKLILNVRALDRAIQKDCSPELYDCILRGQSQLLTANTDDLERLHQKAEATGNPTDALEYNSLRQTLDNFSERLQSLEATYTLCQQTLLIAQQTRDANMALVQAIQNSGISGMSFELQRMLAKSAKATTQDGEKLSAMIDALADAKRKMTEALPNQQD